MPQMIRNANNEYPEPLKTNLLNALRDFPEARKIVVQVFADATVAEPAAADVHADEVDAWTARGWRPV